MSISAKIVPLRGQAAEAFYRGQPIKCHDPDLTEAMGRPIMTEGRIHSFDTEKDDVLVILDGEPGAARRFKPYQLAPGATP